MKDKNKDLIHAKQRKSRGGKYGYKYPAREEAIKCGFRSGYEKTLSDYMTEVLAINFEYETVKIPYTVPEKSRVYNPDFIFIKSSGEKMFIEAKGYLDAEARFKMLHVKTCNPELDIRFCFQFPEHRITKSSKTTYADWAEKNGFPWCGPKLNDAWFKE